MAVAPPASLAPVNPVIDVVGYAPTRSSLKVPKTFVLTAPVAKLTNVLPVLVMPAPPSSANGAASPSAIELGAPWVQAAAGGTGTGVGVGVGTGVGVTPGTTTVPG